MKNNISSRFLEFIRSESAGGILLMITAALAMVLANTPLSTYYDLIITIPVHIRVGPLEITKPLLLWVNDGLMVAFFFLVGLELKRELLVGELSDRRKIALAALGALGGMLVPSLTNVAVFGKKNISNVGYIVAIFFPKRHVGNRLQSKSISSQRSKGLASVAILRHHFEEFELRYDEVFSREHGFYRPIISHVVHKYLKCGDLQDGFARVRCPDCHHEYLLAYSCRGRWFCPSCHSKKVVQFAHHLKEAVLYPVPYWQYVFSIPKILRKFFFYNRKLLGKLSQCAAKSLAQFLPVTMGKKYGIPGFVFAIQTFGDYARWHPHLHGLVADGLFTESGYFYVMPKVDIRPLAELFRANVLTLLKKEGLIDDSFIKMIMSWRHNSGFSVHNQVRIKPGDEQGMENLAQYIIRNNFWLTKVRYTEETGTVVYPSKMNYGKNRKNFQVFDSLEFITAITQHIPEMSFQLVRYHGWYSNRMRGDRKKRETIDPETDQPVEDRVIDIRSFKPKRIPQLMWRECIKKVWEVDLLLCGNCGGKMKIVSFIYERAVIKKILVHLKLDTKPAKQRAPPAPQRDISESVKYVSYDDGWPGYEEPAVDVKLL